MTETMDRELAAANAASTRAQAIWFTWLTVGTYVAIAVGSTTHEQLILENPLRLPIFNVDLALKAFYWVAPGLFLLMHIYVLIQLYLLERNLQLLRPKAAVEGQDLIGTQLDPFFFTQVRSCRQRSFAVDSFMRLTVWVSLVLGPIVLLLAFQIRFLPYHDVATTWWHRIAVILDLLILWALLPTIMGFGDKLRRHCDPPPANGNGAGRSWWRRWIGAGSRIGRRTMRSMPRVWLAVFSVVVVCFSVLVATIPGETMERLILRPSWMEEVDDADQVQSTCGLDCLLKPATWRQKLAAVEPEQWRTLGTRSASWRPTAILFDGAYDIATGRLDSPFSRRLVAPSSSALKQLQSKPSSRGRNLEYALFDRADLSNANLVAAQLKRASLYQTLLKNATLECRIPGQGSTRGCADLEGANLTQAELEGANIKEAILRNANLDGAHLSAATLDGADLRGAMLINAQLRGASLRGASLEGADLRYAQLQGADLEGAQLQGAELEWSGLEGADLENANLDGAVLKNAQLQNTNLKGASLVNADLQGAQLQNADLREARLWHARLDPEAAQEASFRGANLRGLDLGPAPAAETEDSGARALRALAERPIDDEQFQQARAEGLVELACSLNKAFVARGIIKQAQKLSLLQRKVLSHGLGDGACAGTMRLAESERFSLAQMALVKGNDVEAAPSIETEVVPAAGR